MTMRMHVLDLGRMYLDEAQLVAGIHAATFRNQNPAAAWVDIPVAAFLVDYGGGWLLYDTGCNIREAVIPEGGDAVSPFAGTGDDLVEARLAGLGLKPGDVSHVVLSHLHVDHAGYLHLFRGAEAVVAEREFVETVGLYRQRRFPDGPYKYGDFDNFLGANLRWRLLPEVYREYAIVPGVTAINFGPGHAYGMTGLLVGLPEAGNFLLCSDALYRAENFGPPVRLPGLVYDSIGYVRTAEFIRRFAAEKQATVVYGHDKRQFAALKPVYS
ncbi:MAG: N-acyl homoserine lactonase family protein [Acidobacteriota bacterium]|nr:N-acyl homoserine lactonase family protein [Acidobacteriota bacterium]